MSEVVGSDTRPVAPSGAAHAAVHAVFDANGDGVVDYGELKAGLAAIGRGAAATADASHSTVGTGWHWLPFLRGLRSDLAGTAVILCQNGSVAPG